MKQHETLKNLLSNLQSSINTIKGAEDSGKEEGERRTEIMMQRLSSERSRLQQHNLTDMGREVVESRMKVDEKELEYWTHNREIQHGLFETNLKLAQGLTSKVNAMIEAYNSVMSTGTLNSTLAKQVKAAPTILAHRTKSSIMEKLAERSKASSWSK